MIQRASVLWHQRTAVSNRKENLGPRLEETVWSEVRKPVHCRHWTPFPGSRLSSWRWISLRHVRSLLCSAVDCVNIDGQSFDNFHQLTFSEGNVIIEKKSINKDRLHLRKEGTSTLIISDDFGWMGEWMEENLELDWLELFYWNVT